MEFIREIKILDNTLNKDGDILTFLGNTPVLITALETTDIYKSDGTTIFAEQYQKAIARYVAAYTDSSYFIKLRESEDNVLNLLSKYIESNCIKLVIDITGVPDLQENDIKIKPLTKIDKTTLNEITEAFTENGITKITSDEIPNNQTEIDIVKIEVSRTCRDLENPEKLENVCTALVKFIEMYSNYVD